MQSLKAIFTVMLALVWIPLTAHCQLERATGLEVLQCSHEGAGEMPAGSRCDGGSCCSWESGQYHVLQLQPEAAVPMCGWLPSAAAVSDESFVESADGIVPAEAPHKPPRPWQFSTRAALPVRAPSSAS